MAALAILSLAACSKGGPVGQGIAPVSISLLASGANTIATAPGAARVFQCFTGDLAAAMLFSDGSVGNFTNRVHWTSVDPGVVSVSNGDIASFDGTGFYPAGTLVARTPGSTTIRADFSTLHQEITVSVGAPTAFAVDAVLDTLPRTVDNFTMGVGTTQQFVATATVDGMRRNVSSFVDWRVGNASIGSATPGGVLTAQGAGDTTFTAHMALCDQDQPIALHVANISSIYSTLEFGSDPLLIGNREFVHVMAALDDGSGPQDVSSQAKVTTPTSSIVTLYGGTGTNLLVPVAEGTGTVQATLLNLYTAPDITVTVASAGLTGLAILPPGPGSDGNCQYDIVRAGSSEICPYTAMGTFDNGQTQDVTRLVTWAVLDKTLGSANNAGPSSGFVTPAGSSTAIGQTQITATPPVTTSVFPVARTITFDSVTNPAPIPGP